MDKINKLKENIDARYIEDPLQRLRKKMEGRNIKFSLKQVTEQKVQKTMKSLKQKRSAGRDGLSQENLILGSEVLCIPLARIINTSIETDAIYQFHLTFTTIPSSIRLNHISLLSFKKVTLCNLR